MELTYTKSIAYEIELTARCFKIMAVRMFEKLGLSVSPEEFIALDVIADNENICQRDLAKLILKDRASTGKILKVLEEKGLIQRIISTKNNRLIKKIILTSEGKSLLKELGQKLKPVVDEIQNKITNEEIMKVTESLGKFRKMLDSIVIKQI